MILFRKGVNVNKTKKELYEENKKLKEERAMYREFWEVDLLKEQHNTIENIKNLCYLLSIMFLCASCFVWGLIW